MRKYNAKSTYFGFLKNPKEIKKENLAHMYKNYYFSMFLKINDKYCFDLSDGELLSLSDVVLIKRMKSKKENIKEKTLRKRMQKNMKTL